MDPDVFAEFGGEEQKGAVGVGSVGGVGLGVGGGCG